MFDKIKKSIMAFIMSPMMFDSPQAQEALKSGKTTWLKEYCKVLKYIWFDETNGRS